MKFINKTCLRCESKFLFIPRRAEFYNALRDPRSNGWYWNCSCRSTLFVPLRPLRPSASATQRALSPKSLALALAAFLLIGCASSAPRYARLSDFKPADRTYIIATEVSRCEYDYTSELSAPPSSDVVMACLAKDEAKLELALKRFRKRAALTEAKKARAEGRSVANFDIIEELKKSGWTEKDIDELLEDD